MASPRNVSWYPRLYRASDDDLASPLRKRKQRDDEDDGPSKKKIKISREYCREPGYYRCPGCENEDAVDVITRVPSLPGQGVCLNKTCYSSEILRNILMKNHNNPRLPHTREVFLPNQLDTAYNTPNPGDISCVNDDQKDESKIRSPCLDEKTKETCDSHFECEWKDPVCLPAGDRICTFPDDTKLFLKRVLLNLAPVDIGSLDFDGATPLRFG